MKKPGLISAVIMVLILTVGLSTPALAQLDVYVYPSEHNFGDVPLGVTATTIITIENWGYYDVWIDSIGFQAGSSPDFSIAFGPTTPVILRSGDMELLYVWYSPSTLGSSAATLEIAIYGGWSEILEVPLCGTGVESEPPEAGIAICTDPYAQGNSAISGDRIVWADWRNGNRDIYMYDLTAGTEIPICTVSRHQSRPDISGDRIVWSDERGGSYLPDIYMYDLATGTETAICTLPSGQHSPAISGDRIVWRDMRNGNAHIYMYDLATGAETQVTTDPSGQTAPAISGDRIVWIDWRNGNSDIYMYDLATNTETPICIHPSSQRDPAISEDYIVWADSRNGWNIYVYDLTTGTEKQITNNTLRDQFSFPDISGTRVVWTDDRNGNLDIYMYDLATGTETPICIHASAQGHPAISGSGDRIVWTDMRYGNGNIYMRVMCDLWPDIDVSPLVYDFGDVELGTSSTTIVTVSNIGDCDLIVSGIKFQALSSSDFSITASPRVPAVVVPSGTIDVEIAFTPLALIESWAVLEIVSDDPDEGLVKVTLSGVGILEELPPGDQIAAILAFFDASVADGTLVGSGPGSSADGRRNALRNMIEAAGDLIEDGLIEQACQQLMDAYRRTDGLGPPDNPPDFVAGPAAEELANMILDLIASMGCP